MSGHSWIWAMAGARHGGEEEVKGGQNCADTEDGGADGTRGQARRAGRENIMERGKLSTNCFCDTEGGVAVMGLFGFGKQEAAGGLQMPV